MNDTQLSTLDNAELAMQAHRKAFNELDSVITKTKKFIFLSQLGLATFLACGIVFIINI